MRMFGIVCAFKSYDTLSANHAVGARCKQVATHLTGGEIPGDSYTVTQKVTFYANINYVIAYVEDKHGCLLRKKSLWCLNVSYYAMNII